LRYLARCALAAVFAGALLAARPGICVAQQNTAVGQQEPHYKCDTEGVQLEGTLTERTFYGPPEFGETPSKDAREKFLILKLPKPTTVDPIPDEKARSCLGDLPAPGGGTTVHHESEAPRCAVTGRQKSGRGWNATRGGMPPANTRKSPWT
jgi:hypothetical protein